MKTRTNRKQHNKTRRGGGPKKNKSGTGKKIGADRDLDTIVKSINELNDGINDPYDPTIIRQLDILVNDLEKIIPKDGFGVEQRAQLTSVLMHNVEMTDQCLALKRRGKECNFLKNMPSTLYNNAIRHITSI